MNGLWSYDSIHRRKTHNLTSIWASWHLGRWVALNDKMLECLTKRTPTNSGEGTPMEEPFNNFKSFTHVYITSLLALHFFDWMFCFYVLRRNYNRTPLFRWILYYNNRRKTKQAALCTILLIPCRPKRLTFRERLFSLKNMWKMSIIFYTSHNLCLTLTTCAAYVTLHSLACWVT